MIKKSIRVELLQGNNQPLVFSIEMSEDSLLSEVSGTLAFRIITLFQKAKKYKMNLGGFSFARKFDVRIVIDGVEVSGTKSLGLSTIQFAITLQANEGSFDKFHNFIKDLVYSILSGEGQLEGTFEDLKNELCLN